jgi:hypothetical protein
LEGLIMDFNTPLRTIADAEGFLFQLYQLGLSFHPENNAHHIINGATGQPLFTFGEADLINERMEEVHTFMADPCAYLLDITTSTDRN